MDSSISELEKKTTLSKFMNSLGISGYDHQFRDNWDNWTFVAQETTWTPWGKLGQLNAMCKRKKECTLVISQSLDLEL